MGKSQKHLLHMTEQEIYEKVARSEMTLDEALHLFEIRNTQQPLYSPPSLREDSIEEENVALQDGTTRDGAATQEALEDYLCHTLEVFLDLPEQAVDKEENFMELGADSTSLVELTKKIEEEFSVELYPTLFFEYQNIRELAGYLCTTFPDVLVHRFPNQFRQGPSSPQTEQKEPAEFRGDVQHREPLNAPASYSVPESRAQAVQQVHQTEKAEPLPHSGKTQAQEDIAVIGMSGIFPGSPDLQSFWNNLAEGKDLISEIPGDHFDWQPWFDPKAQVGADAIYCKWGGFLADVGMFDAAFFNISPREAEMMDPQLRLLLQVLYHTAEDAGYGQRIRGSHTGMFVGVSGHSYLDEMARLGKAVVPHQGTGNTASMTANRPSFCLHLTGPSLAVDTACSSSLVALHLACTALQRQECDQAFAAGTNLLLSSWHYRYYSSISALSRSGRCHTFDSRADGYVPAESVGAVLLKPLSKAQADNDRIHAIIKGSAVNHGGMTQSVTAPGVKQEAEVLLAAWKDAGIDPETISYVEAHGTGTALGDPVEIRALHKAFKKHTEKEHFCALGSAKAHIGHAESAAGIAGVIKTILSMQHRLIPAMPEFQELNPYIQLEHSPVYINQEAQPWTSPEGIPRRAGVSSFGFGGAYAHVVLEEYPAKRESASALDDTEGLSVRERREEAGQLLLLSAQSEERLQVYAQRLADFLQTDERGYTLRDLAYTLQVGREGLAERLVIKASSLDDACEQLRAYSRGEKEGIFSSSRQSESGKRKTPNAAELLVEGRAGQAFLHILLEDREWDKLARLWTGGIGIDWRLLYASPLPKFLSLPGYPFEEQHYWFDQTSKQAGQGQSVISTASPAVPRTADSGDVADQERAQGDILERLRNLLSLLLKKSTAEINPQVSLLEMGADSIIIMQLVQQVEVLFGQKISVRQIFQELQTLDNLVAYLHHHASASSGERHTDDAVRAADPIDQGIEHHQPVPSRPIDACSSDNSVCKPNISPGTSSAWSTALQAEDQEPLTPQQEEHLQQLIMRYTARTAASKRHETAYRSGFADMRSAIGFRQQTKELCYPIVAQASNGSTITDLDGNEYIDLTMGFGSALFGHKPRFIIEALETQLQHGIQVGPQSDVAGALANDLCKLTGMDRVTFCNSGTEAVMTALRIARAATGRSKIVLFTGSYHGHFDGTLAVASGGGSAVRPMAAGVLQNMIRDVLILPYGTPDSLAAIQDCAHELAAVLVEPVQSRKPDLQPKEFLLTLREITRSAGSLLIFDEMITGFRIHSGGAQAWFGIEADLTTYGKIIGGGMPIGVVAGRAQYMAHIDGGLWNYGDASAPIVERTFYAGTFCKHPLAMAAAQAVVRHLKEQGPALQEGLNEQTRTLVEELNTWFTKVRVPLRVVHFGSLFRFVLTGNFSYVYQTIEMDIFFYHLIAKGIYVWELRTCFLSTAHSAEDRTRIVQAVKESVRELQDGGFFEQDRDSDDSGDSGAQEPSLQREGEDEIKEVVLPLSSSQKEMWIFLQANPAAASAYNQTFALELRGRLQIDRLHQAVNQVLTRHAALRTLRVDGDTQIVADQLTLAVPLYDLSSAGASDREAGTAGRTAREQAEHWLNQEMQQSFDLEQGPLVRAAVLQLDETCHILVMTLHHLIADGWSIAVLVDEIAAIYSAAPERPVALPPAQSYQKFLDWENRLSAVTNDDDADNAGAYWQKRLALPLPVLELPSDHPVPVSKTWKGDRYDCLLEPSVYTALKRLGHQEGVTLFTTLLSSFSFLLSALSGEKNFLLAAPAAGHAVSGAAQMIGQCTVMQPLPVSLEGLQTFSALLSHTQEELLSAQEHQEALFAKRYTLPVPITVIFNMDRSSALHFTELDVSFFPLPVRFVPFDLFLNAVETDESLLLSFDYSTEVFDRQTVQLWAEQFISILGKIVKGPDMPLAGLGLQLPDSLDSAAEHFIRVQGRRVVPDEISKELLQHQAVKQAVVRAEEGHTPYDAVLQAYVVLHTGSACSLSELRTFLSKRLPAYKIPGSFRRVSFIPYTKDGQIDEVALYRLAVEDKTEQREKETAPMDERETAIAELWSEVLHGRTFGPEDNFFAAGGNSLQALQLINGFAKRFGTVLSLRRFFEACTIRQLATLLHDGTATSQSIPSIPLLSEQEDYALSHAQQRLWTLDKMEDRLLAYTVSGALKCGEPIDFPLLCQALSTLIERHESLRTVFIEDDTGRPRQRILHSTVPDAELIDLCSFEDMAAAEAEAVALAEQATLLPFDLAQGPLLRVRMYVLPERNTLLAFILHHIISDVWSIGILIRELFTVYEDLRSGKESMLATLPLQYKDYAAWQNARIQQAEMEEHKAYWQTKFAGQPPLLTLPVDAPRPNSRSYEGKSCRFSLDAHVSKGLREISQQSQTSQFMLLTALVNVLLHKHTGLEDIVLGTVSAGREHPDLAGQIGFYVNTLVLRNRIQAEDRFSDILHKVRQTMLEAHEHQDYPFDALVDDLIKERHPARHPFFEVMLVMDDRAELRAMGKEFALTEVPLDTRTSQFELTWYITEEEDRIDFNLVYTTALFAPERIEHLCLSFQTLIEAVLDAPESRITALDWIPTCPSPPELRSCTVPAARQPLSPHQERLWFVDAFETGQVYASHPVYYNMPLVLELKGEINRTALEQAVHDLVRRHTALRTQILLDEDEQPIQQIQPEPAQVFMELPACTDREAALAQILEEVEQPFDLSADPLFRAVLVSAETPDTETAFLLLLAHHSIADMRSLDILIQEISQLYGASVAGETGDERDTATEGTLPVPEIQFIDFVQWQRTLPSTLLVPQLMYWRNELAGLRALELPTDHPRPAIHTYTAGTVETQLTASLTAACTAYAEQEGVSMHTLLLTVFHVLLHRYSGQDDIVTGIPASPSIPGTEQLIGPVSNLLVLRSDCAGQPDFQSLLHQMQQKLESAYANQDLPFDQLVVALHPKNDMSRTALFDVMLQYQEPESLIMKGLEVERVPVHLGWGKYDLNLCWQVEKQNRKEKLTGVLTYNQDIFDPVTAEAFLEQYTVLLEDVLKHPEKPLHLLSLLPAQEKKRLLYELNQDAAIGYPEDATVHALFEKQARRTPDHTALVLDGQTLSYAALNAQANQLAHYLRKHGVVPDMLVGVCLERSFANIIALLAILKAGGAYVPMDPEYPTERLSFMCQDSGLSLVIANPETTALFSGQDIEIIDPEDTSLFEGEGIDNLSAGSGPEHLAYIIYTSGSTGTPKGVMIEHRNVVRLFFNDNSLFQFSDTDIWTLFHSLCFDFSVWEMYGALLFGGKLVIVPKEIAQNATAFRNLLTREKVTVLNQTPSAFYALIEAELDVSPSELSVQTVIFGGEALKPAQLRSWHARYPATRLINMYGITETTVHVTYKEITEQELQSNTSNIGLPIPTLAVYILDSSGALLPPGVPGELCVAGAGVGRGYLNRPELTAEKFIANPYQPGEKLYRSGDLARRSAQGELIYLDRIDNQVKIRGFRIELGEIEHRLLQLPAVRDAVVLPVTTHDLPFLRAYLVSTTTLPVEELRLHLGQTLPDYMVPAEFVGIEQMPLTQNGKVDRKALVALNGQLLRVHEAEYIAPRNPTEEALVQLWEEVLERHPVGIYDNFFDLGGHSLRAAQLVSRIQKQFSRKIPFRIFFTTPTIADLAVQLANSTAVDLPPIEPVPEQEHYALSSAQYRVWTAEQMHDRSIAYNMTGAVLLTGVFDAAVCEQAFATIIARHESLRTSIVHVAGEPRQLIHPAPEGAVVEVLDWQELKEEAEVLAARLLEEEIRYPFDLSADSLFRIRLAQLRPDSAGQPQHVLLVNMHHIISDGISVTNITQEFVQLYQSIVQGHQVELPPLRIQYKDYAAWQRKVLTGEHGDQLKSYWQEVFPDAVPVLRLPTDFPRPEVRSQAGDMLTFTVAPDLLLSLQELARQQDTSLFTVLLSAVEVLFFHTASQEDIVIGVPMAGRNHPDLESQIGFYINTLPLRVRFCAEDSFTKLLTQVTEAATEAYAHQEYPFEQLVEDLGVQPEQGRHPFFDVLVNMPLQQLALDLPGIEAAFLEDFAASKVDMEFVFRESGGIFEVHIQYCPDLFTKERMEKTGEEFLVLLETIAQNPTLSLIELKKTFLSKEALDEQETFLAATLELDEDF
jgi:glutamate-1-semialdehyde-2,1-aminomutase